MSKHRRSGSSHARATSAAAAAPPAGPESTVSTACPAAAGSVDEPAARLHDQRAPARPAAACARAAVAQVGGEQRGERGVDLGRRRALVLAERADDLVRERHVDAVAQALAQRRADRELVLRDRARRAAGRRRRPRARAATTRVATAAAPAAVSGSSSSGAIRSRRGEAQLGPARSAPGAPRTGGRARARFWRASSTTSVKPSVATSAVRASRSSSSAFVATVIPCANARTSTPAPRLRLAAPPSPRPSRPGTGRPASSAPWRSRRVPAREDRVGEGAADIDAEKHERADATPTSTPRQHARHATAGAAPLRRPRRVPTPRGVGSPAPHVLPLPPGNQARAIASGAAASAATALRAPAPRSSTRCWWEGQ